MVCSAINTRISGALCRLLKKTITRKPPKVASLVNKTPSKRLKRKLRPNEVEWYFQWYNIWNLNEYHGVWNYFYFEIANKDLEIKIYSILLKFLLLMNYIINSKCNLQYICNCINIVKYLLEKFLFTGISKFIFKRTENLFLNYWYFF